MHALRGQTTFIIVNYKSTAHLRGCLESLARLVGDFDVVVVHYGDDAPTDLASERVAVKTVRENHGFAWGANYGARYAKGDVFCFLNPDTMVLSREILAISEVLRGDARGGAAAPQITNHAGTEEWWSYGVVPTLWQLVVQKIYPKYKNKKNPEWLSGAALFVPRRVFGEVGGFDEKFFLYYEDVDLCVRIARAGYTVERFSAYRVVHERGASSRGDQGAQKEHYKVSQEYFFRKHYTRAHVAALRILRRLYTHHV